MTAHHWLERYESGLQSQVWLEMRQLGAVVLPVAPDRLHKQNVSGGPPGGFVLPDGCVDALFVAETTMPFVASLNHVFRHGGFPWPTTEPQWRVTRTLAADLLLL